MSITVRVYTYIKLKLVSRVRDDLFFWCFVGYLLWRVVRPCFIVTRECFTLRSALGVCFVLLSTITQADHYDLIKPAPDSKDRGLWENQTFLICSISAALKNNTEIVNLKDRQLGFFRLDFDGPLHTVEWRK